MSLLKSCWSSDFVEAVNQYIQTYYADNELIRVGYVAKHFGYTRWYFSTQYRFAMGQTFSSYLDSVRLSEACYLLENTVLPCHRVAVEVGFVDASHFARAFKRRFGQTPKAYREQVIS